jgi:hypothetical protein
MAPVAVQLLTRPPESSEALSIGEMPTVDALPALAPEEFEIIIDSDKLMRACSCSNSSDQPY